MSADGYNLCVQGSMTLQRGLPEAPGEGWTRTPWRERESEVKHFDSHLATVYWMQKWKDEEDEIQSDVTLLHAGYLGRTEAGAAPP